MKEDEETDVLNAVSELFHNLNRIEQNVLLLKSAEAQEYIKTEPQLEEIFEAVQGKLKKLNLNNLDEIDAPSKQEHP